MDAQLDALDSIRRDGVTFLRSSEARLLAVTVDELISASAVGALEQLEWHPANRWQFISLTGGHFPRGGGVWWRMAAELVRNSYQAVRISYAMEGKAAPPDLPKTDETDSDPLLYFAKALAPAANGISALSGGPASLMVLAAPGEVEAPEDFARGLSVLLNVPGLAAVRWICVGDSRLSVAIEAQVDRRQLKGSAAKVDGGQQHAAVEAFLNTLGRASDAPERSRPGLAVPPEPIPRHPSDPPAGSPGASTTGGMPRAAFVPLADAIRAFRSGDFIGAIRHQRAVCDLCVGEGLVGLAVDMELILASYTIHGCLSTGTSPAPAIQVLQSAASRAIGGGLSLAAAKAHYILGTFASTVNEHHLAGESFRSAAGCAGAAGAAALQIEALRAAADRLLAFGSTRAAAMVLSEAAATGERLSPDVAATTSLRLVLQRLADLHPDAVDSAGGDDQLDIRPLTEGAAAADAKARNEEHA